MEKKYVLAFKDEPGRALVSISLNYIGFNISSYKEFDSIEAAEDFRSLWKSHFYPLHKLQIIPSPKKTHQT